MNTKSPSPNYLLFLFTFQWTFVPLVTLSGHVDYVSTLCTLEKSRRKIGTLLNHAEGTKPLLLRLPRGIPWPFELLGVFSN